MIVVSAVNPDDIAGLATTVWRAFEMSLVKRRERWSELFADLREHESHGWRDEFLHALYAARRHRSQDNRPFDNAIFRFVRRKASVDIKTDRGPLLAQSP